MRKHVLVVFARNSDTVANFERRLFWLFRRLTAKLLGFYRCQIGRSQKDGRFQDSQRDTRTKHSIFPGYSSSNYNLSSSSEETNSSTTPAVDFGYSRSGKVISFNVRTNCFACFWKNCNRRETSEHRRCVGCVLWMYHVTTNNIVWALRNWVFSTWW